ERRRQLLHQVLGDRVVALAPHDDAGDRALAPDVDQLAHRYAVKRGMPPASSVHRKAIVFAMSSGCPNRLKTVRDLNRSYIGLFAAAALPASDSMIPGAIALAVMLCRPPSRAAVLARPMSPAFVAE